MAKVFYNKDFASRLEKFLPDELEVKDTADRWATIFTSTPPIDVVAFIEGENTVRVTKREWLPAIEDAAKRYEEKHENQIKIE